MIRDKRCKIFFLIKIRTEIELMYGEEPFITLLANQVEGPSVEEATNVECTYNIICMEGVEPGEISLARTNVHSKAMRRCPIAPEWVYSRNISAKSYNSAYVLQIKLGKPFVTTNSVGRIEIRLVAKIII